MRYQEIIKTKKRTIKLLWTLSILLLSLVLSGWLTPIGAQVTLCGDPFEPDSDGIYRQSGHLTCYDPSTDPILEIKGPDAADTEFDLRGLIATGDGDNTGIHIRDGANNVMIRGGHFRKCKTALRVEADDCEIEHFMAIDSSDKAIRIRGDGNIIVKSLCLRAGNDCFELRGKERQDGKLAVGNTTERCTAIKYGTEAQDEEETQGQGFQFRDLGPGYAYKCSAIGGVLEGFQIQKPVSDVTIERCLAIKNAEVGIEIKEGATGNSILHNIAFANGDGIESFDLIDENDTCELNTWKGNKFRSSNQPFCIK